MTVAQECRRKAKDIWIMQKCAEILQNASKTYDYAARTAAGLADLAGMCEDRTEFGEMMKVVVGLPSLIQQQAEAKVNKAEKKTDELPLRTESVSTQSIQQLMVVTGLPEFNQEWESPEFESTRYLVAIFEFWLRKSMFPKKKLKHPQYCGPI